MKVLVTGSAGYIGSRLIRHLLDNGYEVVAVDNLMYDGKSLLAYVSEKNFQFVNADIADEEDVKKMLADDFYAVVHLAAIVGDPACRTNPNEAVRTNFEGSKILIDYADKMKIKRFIFASTCSNYGKMEGSQMLDETGALAPLSLYAETKVKVEKYIIENKFDYLKPTILRFSTVYGPSQRMRFDLTVNHFTKDAFKNNKLVVFGEQFWRPYCHVEDICRAILLALKSDKALNNIFNVGSSEENYTKQMICNEIKKAMPNVQVEYVKKQEDPRDYKVSFDKIKQELGFETSKTILDGITEIYNLLKSNIITDLDNQIYVN